jgi:hypothetical protein
MGNDEKQNARVRNKLFRPRPSGRRKNRLALAPDEREHKTRRRQKSVHDKNQRFDERHYESRNAIFRFY